MPVIGDDDEVLKIEDGDEGEDAGLDDDEGGSETEAGQELEGAEAEEGEVEKPSRGERRQQKLANELKEMREHNARVQQELQELRQQRQQAQQPQEESEEVFQARASLMTTEERLEARLARSERIHQRQMAAIAFQSADRADRAAFEARAASDSVYKKYGPEVERILQAERMKGRDFDRETVLNFVLGQAVRANRGKVDQARAKGKTNIQRQQARTAGGRGDQTPDRRQPAGKGNSLADLEARLANVYI